MKDFRMYDLLNEKLRTFFRGEKGFVEVPAQPRLSILAACEDPNTIATFEFSGTKWPLPQTGQMQLEADLLANPELPGVFCCTTSYRNEPNPIPGRHDKIFPMFEFESHGTMKDLIALEAEALEFLGFEPAKDLLYEDACKKYGVDVLLAEHEALIQRDFGNSVSLQSFPLRTDPFWNMKRSEREDGMYNKVDVLLFGMETFGSAERSTNVDEMRHDFATICGGQYAHVLFEAFGKERVTAELDRYLTHAMIPRFGCGIGMTRLARAFKLRHL